MNNDQLETGMDPMSQEHRITSVLGRLESIIDHENANIGSDPNFDFKVSNAHKSRCLYELTMLFRDSDQGLIASGYVDKLNALREKLALNSRRVEAHLNAVRTVADLLKNAIKEADEDGTYSQEQFLYNAAV
jgi:uncharacterized protein YunC (DUF1805 family)